MWGRDGAAPAPRQALGAGSVPSSSGAPVNWYYLIDERIKERLSCGVEHKYIAVFLFFYQYDKKYFYFCEVGNQLTPI